MEDTFQIGIVTTAHGIKGEFKVYPTTDDPGRFKKLKEVYVDNGKTRVLKAVESVKFFKQFVILKVEGVNTMDDALLYRNASLLVDRQHAVKLAKNEYFIADLIGLKVYDDTETKIGELTDVLQTGANDVYEVTKEDGTSFLVPAIKDCILDVQPEEGFIRIHIMDGLL